MKSELPDKEDLILNMFYVNPTDKDKEVIINDIGFSFDQIIKAMEEYGQQCISKTLEIAAEEAYPFHSTAYENILKLKEDPRLKP